jgi:hypothetical protein
MYSKVYWLIFAALLNCVLAMEYQVITVEPNSVGAICANTTFNYVSYEASSLGSYVRGIQLVTESTFKNLYNLTKTQLNDIKTFKGRILTESSCTAINGALIKECQIHAGPAKDSEFPNEKPCIMVDNISNKHYTTVSIKYKFGNDVEDMVLSSATKLFINPLILSMSLLLLLLWIV